MPVFKGTKSSRFEYSTPTCFYLLNQSGNKYIFCVACYLSLTPNSRKYLWDVYYPTSSLTPMREYSRKSVQSQSTRKFQGSRFSICSLRNEGRPNYLTCCRRLHNRFIVAGVPCVRHTTTSHPTIYAIHNNIIYKIKKCVCHKTVGFTFKTAL